MTNEKLTFELVRNSLEEDALTWINNLVDDYSNGYIGVCDDLQKGGCESGMVEHLISFADTCEYYNRHKAIINEYLIDLIDNTGLRVDELFPRWNTLDPLALDIQNQNLLAWFGFEESCNRLISRRGNKT